MHSVRHSFAVREESGVAVLAARGDIDYVATEAFRTAREDALALRLPLVIELSECDFIDSTGIACIIRSFQEATRREQGFALVGSPKQVGSVLELVGMPRFVPSFTTLEEAVRHLRGPG